VAGPSSVVSSIIWTQEPERHGATWPIAKAPGRRVLYVRIGAWAFCLLHNTQGTGAKREEAKGMRGGVVPIAIGILVLIILIIIISYL
jgi:hypothetical protein